MGNFLSLFTISFFSCHLLLRALEKSWMCLHEQTIWITGNCSHCLRFVWDNLLRFNIYLENHCPDEVSHAAESTIFKYMACVSTAHTWTESLWGQFWGFMHLFQSWSENQAALKYYDHPTLHRGTHTKTHASSTAATQGQQRRFIFIVGKGAKSCWYVGDYINANCIGELIALEKVCM